MILTALFSSRAASDLPGLARNAARANSTAPAPDPNDPIQRIKDEGMKRSQVMQTLSYLSDVIGPRLTASPGMKRANEWTRDQLTKWGLAKRASRTVGTIRTRLDAEEVLRTSGRTTGNSFDRLSESVVAGFR